MTASSDPSLPESEEWSGAVADVPAVMATSERVTQFEGRIWSVISEDVDFGPVVARRDVLLHPGAVAVIAMDDDDRVLLIRQYRHPVAMLLFEPPAGLMDTADETGWQTAQRELAEEAGYRASRWDVLADVYLSPGGMSEAVRIFLARGLESLPGGRLMTGEAEEAHLPRAWVPLAEATTLVLGGEVGSPTAVIGILAAEASRARGWTTLRPPDSRWSAREHLESTDRVRRLS